MILLVTVDGLDWAALDEAVRQGRLPAAARLLRGGSMARLRPDVPPGGCAWWGSLATGSPPLEHGLVYPLEGWAGGLRPVTRQSWQRPPVWEVLANRGHRTASIAYPFARPGTSWAGVHVDDRLLEMSGLGWDDWPLPPEVGPEGIREDLRSIRVHVSDVPSAMLAPFEAAEPLDGQRRQALTVALARLSTLFGAAEVVAAHGRPEFLAVHLDSPAQFAGALGVQHAGELPPPFWSLLDGSLWKLAQLAGAGSTLVLVSPGTGGRCGFVGVSGPLAREQLRGGTASVLDVARLLLASFGESLPPAERAVAEIAADPEDRRRVESFGHQIPSPPPGWPAPRLIAEAELLLETDLEAAGAKAAEALATEPGSIRALGIAGLVAFARREIDALERLAMRMAAVAPHHLWTAMLQAGCHVLRKDARAAAPLLRRIEAKGNADDRLRLAGAWLMLGRGSDAERLFESVIAERPDCIPALLGLASRKARRPFDAEQLLRRVLAIDPTHREARAALVDLLRSCGRGADAAAVAHF